MAKTKESEAEVKPVQEEAVYTRDDLALSADFKEHKWLLYAIIKKDEQVTKAEAHKRITAFLNKTF